MQIEIGEHLREILVNVISNGGGIAIASWLLARPFMQQAMEKTGAWLQTQIGIGPSEFKRYAALVIGTLIGVGLWVGAAELGYLDYPEPTFEGWVNLILTVGSINFVGTHIVHARTDLSERDRRRRGPAQVKITRE